MLHRHCIRLSEFGCYSWGRPKRNLVEKVANLCDAKLKGLAGRKHLRKGKVKVHRDDR